MTTKYLIKSRFFVSALFLAFVFVVILLSSCKKEKEEEPDTNSPAFKISESEKLTIPTAIDLPANPPNGNTRVATFFADGVQKYKSQEIAGSNPVAYQWQFVAPQAYLYDATNKKVGTHSAGPTWQLIGGADSLYGQAFTPPKSAPSSDPGAIDWLLLMPKTGKTPTGIFANVSYIQRVDTKGGKAPATAPLNADQTADVPYTAIYRFTKIN